MKSYLIHPAQFKLDGGAMFGIIPKPLWQRYIQPDELNRISLALRIWYLPIGDKHILVDTGIGDYHGEKFEKNFAIHNNHQNLQGTLKKHFNLNPDDITDIVLTHLHFDHVGGLGTLDSSGLNQTLFPKATIHLHQKHYDYAQNPTLRDSGSFHLHFFKPLLDWYQERNQLHFLNDEIDGEILPGLNYKVSFGHTPYMIHPYTDNYIYMADLVPTSHHIKLPWVMGYDINPGTTTIYKKKFYDFILKNNLSMIFEHDIDYCCSQVSLNERKSFESNHKIENTKEVLELF